MAKAFPSRGRRYVAARNNLAALLGTLSGPCHLRKRVAGGRGLWYTEPIWAAPAALCKVSRGPLWFGPHPDKPQRRLRWL